MTVQNRFTKHLSAPAKDRPVLDALASTGEAVADIFTKDDLISAVPFVSTAFKTVKAIDSYRDRLFAEKLQAFVSEVGTLSQTERAAMAQKLTEDDEGRKAGETLLLVLDKLTDMDKPALLGFLLVQFGRGHVNAIELRRLATAVDVAFGEDLAQFLAEPLEIFKETKTSSPHRESLLAAGLTRVHSGKTWATVGAIEYAPTVLGNLLYDLMRIER